MRTSLHDIHLPARRIFALLISVATLIATLPTAARAQAEPPGALDLATLPGTLNNNWYINLAYLNGTWVYKVGASDTQAPTTGTPFNGTITGTMPEVGRQFVIHPSTDSDSVLTSADPDSGNPPALTLKDAVITSSFNQLFYIKAGAEPTLRIEGENRIEIMSVLIYNLGTLTLTVADAQEISQGILNGSPAGTGTLTVYAQAPLSIGAISNFQNARMHLDGEIHVISKTGGSAFKNDNTSPDAITFGDNARIHLQANALCTYVSGFIELDFDTAPTDGRTLSVTPAGDDEPAAPSRPTGPAGVTPSSPRPIRGIPPPSTASGYMPAGVTAGLPIKTETTPSSGQTGHTADTPAPPPPAPPRSRSTFPRTTATAAPAPASTSSSTPRTDGTATRRCSTGR